MEVNNKEGLPKAWAIKINDFLFQCFLKELFKNKDGPIKKDLTIIDNLKRQKKGKAKELVKTMLADLFEKKSNSFWMLEQQELEPLFLKEVGTDNKISESISSSVINFVNKYNPNIWIEKLSNSSVTFQRQTHVPKLTHSSSRASIHGASFSTLIKQEAKKTGFIGTFSTNETSTKFGVSSNEYAPYVKFLELEYSGESLYQFIENLDASIFLEVDKSKSVAWTEKIKSKLSPQEKKSADGLLKQIYFPVNEDYELLGIVTSDSLAQAVYELYRKSPNLNMNGLRENLRFPSIAIRRPANSNFGNVSGLHNNRGGVLFNFSSVPPNFSTNFTRPPKYTVFSKYLLGKLLGDRIEDYKVWIIRNINRKSNQVLRTQRTAFTQSILDVVINYGVSVQNNFVPGWSIEEDLKLPIAQKYWLDPNNPDEQFQSQRRSLNWTFELSEDFARWLCKKLETGQDKFKLYDLHFKYFSNEFLDNIE